MKRRYGKARQIWKTLRQSGITLTLLMLAGCVSTGDQRAQQFNEEGVFLFGRGDYRGASECFEAALTLNPRDAGVLYNLGQCHDRTGDWRRAEQFYCACLETSPEHGDARMAQLSILYRTGRASEANRLIEEWLQKEPNRADALVFDAWRLRQEKALPQAQARLQQALALEPNNRRALVEMGVYYELTGRPDRSLALYERALEKDSHQPEVADRVEQMRAKGVKRPLPD